MPRRKEPRIPDTLLDQLLAGADPKTVFDPLQTFGSGAYEIDNPVTARLSKMG
jgi:hypothetical protein